MEEAQLFYYRSATKDTEDLTWIHPKKCVAQPGARTDSVRMSPFAGRIVLPQNLKIKLRGGLGRSRSREMGHLQSYALANCASRADQNISLKMYKNLHLCAELTIPLDVFTFRGLITTNSLMYIKKATPSELWYR